MSTIELPVDLVECKALVSDADMETNLYANMALGLAILKLSRACVVGGGPSVLGYLDEIRQKQKEGFVVYALNGAAELLHEHGITPDWQIIYDAQQSNVDFITCLPNEGFLVASHAHPDVIKRIQSLPPRYILLFHAAASKNLPNAIRARDKKAHILGCGITVGLQALNIMTCVGHRVVHLYGYDSSFKDDQTHAYSQPQNAEFRRIHVNHRGVKYTTNGAMAAQAQEFTRCYKLYGHMGIKLEVFGDGLLPAMWRAQETAESAVQECLNNFTDESERIKYETVWEIESYRRDSPGELLLGVFFTLCKPHDESTFIDFGCGTGRAMKKLDEVGFNVRGIDIAGNCLDEGVEVPFLQANLWELSRHDIDPCDWGYCVNVMEHIPEQKVEDVLGEIASHTRVGCFFGISFVKDDFGSLVNDVLHMTVKPSGWWIDLLRKYFADVVICKSDMSENGVFVCRHVKKEAPES
jgi:2-polyprenyl-3-methyl-5-hydroxy-6-metoxy-1,4-benzoquinol methylase/uncharacterized Rossmann fold enzyme